MRSFCNLPLNVALRLIERELGLAIHFVDVVSARVADYLRNSPGFRSCTAACAGGRPLRRMLGKLTLGDSIFIPAASKILSAVWRSPHPWRREPEVLGEFGHRLFGFVSLCLLGVSLAFFSSSLSFWSFSSSSLASFHLLVTRARTFGRDCTARKLQDCLCNTFQFPIEERLPLPFKSCAAVRLVKTCIWTNFTDSSNSGVLSSPCFFAASDSA